MAPPPLHPGYLAVTCWCERFIDHIPAADVRAGSTWSCGARCHPGCSRRRTEYKPMTAADVWASR